MVTGAPTEVVWPPPRDPWLLWGDCLDLMPRLPDDAFDLVFADPPYNLSRARGLAWAFSSHVTPTAAWDRYAPDDYRTFTALWLAEAWRLLRPGGSIVVCASYHSLPVVGSALASLPDARVLNDIVWFKPNAQPNITCRTFTQSTETLFWAAKGSGWTFDYDAMKRENGGKQMRNVWTIPVTPASEKVPGHSHPTQKPLKLVRRVLRALTRPGDLVLDPFVGTGTTLVAARELGRRAVGIERDEATCRPIVEARLRAVQTRLS